MMDNGDRLMTIKELPETPNEYPPLPDNLPEPIPSDTPEPEPRQPQEPNDY
ncbi:MAG: hypothetical protein Q8R24_08540 [Legionellaceae bacterium]|nr:hypothetical protein [Legionellaceae bacterium]